MKKLIIASIAAFTLASCNQTTNTTEKSASKIEYYGDKITEENAIDVSELAAKMGDATAMEVKLTGVIDEVCQKKGCWMTLKNANGESLRITFKDYAFFMPKDGSGRVAIAEGIAKVEETSVADLQEYAKDAGKSAEEIAAITESEKELVFEASGVILK
jgi:hypothetical protein